MAALSLTESELRFISALARRKVRFMVVGLSAAAFQGAPVVTQDVDLWFENLADPRIARALKAIGAAYVPPFELNPPMFAGSGAELFDIVTHMHGLGSFKEELKNCIVVKLGAQKLKVLRIDRILASKRAANRPKDRLVIPVLEHVLAVTQTLKAPTGGKRRVGNKRTKKEKEGNP